MTDYIRRDDDLREYCERARDIGLFGVDLEFIRERSYYPRLALIQMVVDDELALIDPLTEIDLSPIDRLISDASVVKVLHAPAQDLEIFFNRSGELPRSIYDTQTAAAFLGLGNQISYGGLVEKMLDVTLVKGESFTDWLRRPLSPKQEDYALDDVRYLLPLKGALDQRLKSLGRLDWLTEECSRFERRQNYVVDLETLYKKVKRSNSLNDRGLTVLQALTIWREEEARRRDRPRRSVVSDEVLVEIARVRPKSERDLSRFRGLHPKEQQRSGRAIVAAVRQGESNPTLRLPKGPKRRLGTDGEAMLEFVQACMRALCRQADMASTLIGNNSDLEALVLDYRSAGSSEEMNDERHPILQGWRRTLIGDPLLAIMRGDTSVRLDPKSGVPTFDRVR